MARWWWEQPKRPSFDVEYIQEHNGRWTFVLRHYDHVEAVANIQGFPNKEAAEQAVKSLAGGFDVGNVGYSGTAQSPAE